jgi:transcriptional regulator with XRE-family HTH domain
LVNEATENMSTLNQIDCPISIQHVGLIKFLFGLDAKSRIAFCGAVVGSSDQLQQDVLQMVEIVANEERPANERQRALMTIADALHLNPDKDGRYGMNLVESEADAAKEYPQLARKVEAMNNQEAEFAERLRTIMKDKNISQSQLAERINCSQPAVSQMLNRKCRPQRKTLNKIAAALGVDARELWPDLEVAEYLDAVAEFSRDDYIMSEAEAEALRDTTQARSSIKGNPLPSRKK